MDALHNHKGMTRTLTAMVAVIFAAAFQIITPVLPVIGLGEPIGSQSQEARTLITPAGWAFSIWGALYTGAILFAIFQALPSERGPGLVTRLRWPAAGAFLGNGIWAAYVQIAGISPMSVLIIVLTLSSLLVAFRRLTAWRQSYTTSEKWCAVVPLSALTAWLTVATTVNVAASLSFSGVDAGDAAAVISAAIVLVAGCIAAAVLHRSKGSPAYALVFLWALAAIFASGGSQATLVGAAAVVAAVMVLAGALSGVRWSSRGRTV